MNTWTKENPSEFPAPRLTAKLVGGVRLVLLLLLTAVSVALFLVGRFLRGTLGRWVTFHFGVARFWSRGCLWLAGIRLRVTGTPVRAGALVANHSSWIDILALRATTLMYFVSKSEVADWPGVGFITRITGTVFIERKRTEAKRQEAVLRSRIAQDQLLCLFPEGTSTDGLRVLPFKSSLFSAFFIDGAGADIMIQPVSLRYHPPKDGSLPPDIYGWWGTMGFEKHIWDVLTLSFGGTVDVIFHQAAPASAYADRKSLAEASQIAVAAGFETLAPVRMIEQKDAVSAEEAP
ncbi:MAG: lysophospholipid acyltransferase family protein [Pseudomonadota bacterium]